MIGTAPEKAGVLSFVLDGSAPKTSAPRSTRKASPSAPATTARSRSCAASASRARCAPSLALYNTCEDIDSLVAALLRIQAGRGHRGL